MSYLVTYAPKGREFMKRCICMALSVFGCLAAAVIVIPGTSWSQEKVDAGAVARSAPLDPYDEKSLAADTTIRRPAIIYTNSNAPGPARLADLPLQKSVSQYGITWTFAKPARVGQFVNGDWYVVGPVTIEAIAPRPLYGAEIPPGELDQNDQRRPEEQHVRNGFMLNPPASMKVAYDSGIRNWFDPSLIQKLPVAMKPGDSLVSTISMPKGLTLHAQLRNEIQRGVEDEQPGAHGRRADLRGRAAAARRLPPGLLRSRAENLSGPQPQARTAARRRRNPEPAQAGAVHPLHAAAVGRQPASSASRSP